RRRAAATAAAAVVALLLLGWAVTDAGTGWPLLVRVLHLSAFTLWLGGALWNIAVAMPAGRQHANVPAGLGGAQQLDRFRLGGAVRAADDHHHRAGDGRRVPLAGSGLVDVLPRCADPAQGARDRRPGGGVHHLPAVPALLASAGRVQRRRPGPAGWAAAVTG